MLSRGMGDFLPATNYEVLGERVLVKENARDRKGNKNRIQNKGVQSKFHASGVD